MPKVHSPRFRDVNIPGVRSIEPKQDDAASSSKYNTHIALGMYKGEETFSPKSSHYTFEYASQGRAQQGDGSGKESIDGEEVEYHYATSAGSREIAPSSVHHYSTTVDPRVNQNTKAIIYVNDSDQPIYRMQRERESREVERKMSKTKINTKSVSKLPPNQPSYLPAELTG